MSIAQTAQLRDLTERVVRIEGCFREAAEIGNWKTRVDNLESTVSSILHELKQLSGMLTTATNEAGTKDPQGAKCQSSATATSAQSSAPGSAAPSTGRTANSGASAKMR